MKLFRKQFLQKSVFIISVFALGIVASGGVEKRTSGTSPQRSPASILQHSHLVKENLSMKSVNSETCDYSVNKHKVCENQTQFE